MLVPLPRPLRIVLASVLALTNLTLHAVPLLLLALPKLLLPLPAARRRLSRALVGIGESWIAVNSRLLALFTPTRFELHGLEGLRYEGWYLVLSNHQSWVDIPVLQLVLNRRVPFLKFFLKQQLIWVPVLGLAWWALDFPFMRRYPRALLERRPELRGRDMAATRRACARFRDHPVSVMNFVEGTRFSPAKHAAQQSPYRYLLKPRAGGVGFVLDAMGDVLRSALDVTIVYPHGQPTLADLVAGRVPRVVVSVTERPLPPDLLARGGADDPALRQRRQTWINALWAEKDALIARLAAKPVDISLENCDSALQHAVVPPAPRERPPSEP